MKSEIQFSNLEHGFAVAEAAGCIFNPIVDQVISITSEGYLQGGVIYTNYTGASINAHIAGFSKNWMTRDLLWVIFDYPFNQLRCKKLIGQVRETNTKALEFDLKLGFNIEARIEDAYPDGACLVLSLYRDDCRWLKLKPRDLKSGSET